MCVSAWASFEAMGAGKVGAFFVAASFLLAGTSADSRTRGKLDANELPMNVVDGYLVVVQGSIGDHHGLKFLLDTGVTTSAIDHKLAERLSLPTRSGQMVNFDKTVQVQWCVLPELVYGPQHAANIKVAVEDLRYLRASGAAVDGVIGWDLLRRSSFRLDFENKRVVFGALSAIKGRSVRVRESSLCLTVPIVLDGRELWVIADTGMRGTMFYEPQLDPTSYQWQAAISGRTVGGNVESQIVLAPRLRLGSQDLDRQVYVVRRPDSALLEGIAGYLGVTSLNAKQVTFDLDRGVLSWQ
jgi:hypothetical protein